MRLPRRPAALAPAALASLAFAGTAGAITITDLRVDDDDARTEFSATLVSPPAARTCTALARAVMVSYDRGAPRVVKALGRHRINVCRGGRTGYTTGSLTGFFSTTTLKRPNRYALCISAEQVLRNGRTSRHHECRPVDLATEPPAVRGRPRAPPQDSRRALRGSRAPGGHRRRPGAAAAGPPA